MKRAAGFVFVAGVLGLALAYAMLPRAPSRKPESLPKLAQELDLAFPPSTRLIVVYRENGMDERIAVKLRMDEREVEPFLRTTPIRLDSMVQGDVAGRLGMDHDAWDPGQAAQLRTGHVWMEKEARALNIGVSRGKPGEAVLFVVTFGT